MGWKVWGDPWLTTGSMQDTTLYTTLTPPENIVLRAVRTWVIYYDDPVYTSLNMKIYSNRVVDSANTPINVLHTSTDVRTRAEIKGDDDLPNGVREIYFTFADVPLRGGAAYNFVINATGYAPAGDAHLAWRKAFPDPVYTGYDPTATNLPIAPYELYMIGAPL